MSLVAAILLAALSRAEIVERFRAGPVTQLEGMVQVWADCGSEMRREFQLPVAIFVAGVCRELYRAENVRPRKFAEPGIVVHIGGETNVVTQVAVRRVRRDTGGECFRFTLPAPGHADRDRLRLETVKAFYALVLSTDLDDAAALAKLRAADPELRIADEYAELEAWLAGERGGEDDERFLKLQRGVLDPGRAHPRDVRTFASRLFLYPPQYDLRFADGSDVLSFREAIDRAADTRVRLAAYLKINTLGGFGNGRGSRMNLATIGYVEFLRKLAGGTADAAELRECLDAADAILKGAANENEKDDNRQ